MTQQIDDLSVGGKAADQAKPVIRILEGGRDTGADSAPAHLDVVTPRAPAGSAAFAGLGAMRVALWGTGVELAAEPVRTPCMNVLRNIEQAVRVGRSSPH